jgi:hypothetical protein
MAVSVLQANSATQVLYPGWAADGTTMQLYLVDKFIALLVELRVANDVAQATDPISLDLNALRADAMNAILPSSASI